MATSLHGGRRLASGPKFAQFSHYSDLALAKPVVVTKNGRPRNVLMSVDEYERLKSRDRQAFIAANAPERFLADIRATAKRRR